MNPTQCVGQAFKGTQLGPHSHSASLNWKPQQTQEQVCGIRLRSPFGYGLRREPYMALLIRAFSEDLAAAQRSFCDQVGISSVYDPTIPLKDMLTKVSGAGWSRRKVPEPCPTSTSTVFTTAPLLFPGQTADGTSAQSVSFLRLLGCLYLFQGWQNQPSGFLLAK